MVGVFCVFCASLRPTLRHPPGAIRGHPDMGWKAHATWHGLSSPWVWGGPYALRPPSSDHSVPSCQKFFRVFRVFRGPTLRCPSSVVRRPSSAVSRPIRFLRVLRLLAANPRSSPHPSRSAPEHSRGRNDSASSKTITPALAPSFAIHQSSCEGLRS